MKRRTFVRTTATGAMALGVMPGHLRANGASGSFVRLGGPIFEKFNDPGQWVEAVKRLGYRTANSPVNPGAETGEIKAYKRAAMENDLIIAEVGAWSNPISQDQDEANAAIEKCIQGLVLADEINARCCVNISGSKNIKYWAGPHKDNLTTATFDQVVEVTRKIIDAVKPTRSFFALEAMPWSFPDSTDSYLKLLLAIDRKQFGVHLDPVNMIRSPREYYGNGVLIRDMFKGLGPYIKSCHAKDIILREDNYIPQLDELRAGLGNLDYATYLQELAKLDNVPLMMEHLKTAEEYKLAADHIRSVGQSVQITV